MQQNIKTEAKTLTCSADLCQLVCPTSGFHQGSIPPN